ncbi:MAG: MATE family efflux transporter [Muribaculaceae bacterium]|nr:MATE family efflux transporter [Muribaculaceae bacterium]
MKKDRNLTRDSIDFGNGRIGPLFRALFFPTLIGMIFNSALTLIDGIFVGQGVGANGIAAVNIVAPIFMVSTGIGLMFGIGSSVIASIRLSENNVKAARIIMTQAFLVGIILLGIFTLLCLAAPHQLLALLGCSPVLEEYGMSYMLWLAPGLIFLYLECVGMMLIRLDGSPKYAMWVQIIAVIVNLVLDYVMIFPLGWGLMGAALATSIACGVGGLMVLAYFVRWSDKLKFYRLKCTLTSLLLTLRNAWYMMKIGFATFLTELAMSVMMLTGNYMFISLLGEAGVAAYAIACYLFPLVFSISNAVAQSAQPIISFNYGAGNMGRVSQTLRVSVLTAVICGVITWIGLWFGSSFVVGLFLSHDESAYELAVSGLPYFSVCAVFFAVNIAFIGYYQSLERSLISTLYTLLRGMILLVPSFILLPRVIGVNGLWLAIPCAEILTCGVITAVYLISARHKPQSPQSAA